MSILDVPGLKHMADPVLVVITGGDTPERSGSLASARHIFEVLRDHHQVVLVELSQGEWTILDAHLALTSVTELTFHHVPPILRHRDSGETIRPAAAVISIHGRPGESGELQGYLDIVGIPYSGSGVLASSLAADKARCKSYLAATIGIAVPRQWQFDGDAISAHRLEEAGVRPPFVIKPNGLGSGLGVFSVHAGSAIDPVLRRAASLSRNLLVEEYVDGVELTAGAIRLSGQDRVFEIAEVIRPQCEEPIRAYTSRREARMIIPARIPASIAAELRARILEIGEVLDLRGWYRADFILSGEELHFLEVNSVPGTARDSVLVRQAAAAGVSADRLFEMLVLDLLSSA